MEYYEQQGKLIELDGTKAINHVNKEILENLGKQLVKNQLKEWKQNKKRSLPLLVDLVREKVRRLFYQKGIADISFGKIVNDYIDKHKLGHTEAVHKKGPARS